VTTVVVEGRKILRLFRELTPEVFGALLTDYRRLLHDVLERSGGYHIETFEDTATAAFPTAKEAVHAAVRVNQMIAAHEWPHGREVAVSIGIHSGAAGVGWVGPAIILCGDLCDAAEGGQIFASQATASLLEDEDLGQLRIRELGEQKTRRTDRAVRAFEIVVPSVAETPSAG
jgi:class 3 adenylate cyclase